MTASEAIEQAYREHGWHVYRRAMRILRNEAEAQDVLQDVFVKLASAFPELSHPDKLMPWVFRVTTNACLDRLRLRKDHDPARLDRLAAPSHVDEELMRRQRVLALLASCPAEEQQVALLRFIDECTLEEIEQITGHTRKTVSRHLERFLSRVTTPHTGDDPSRGGSP